MVKLSHTTWLFPTPQAVHSRSMLEFFSLRCQPSLTGITVWISMQTTCCLRTVWDTNPGLSSKPNKSNQSTLTTYLAWFQRHQRLLCPADYLEAGCEDMFWPGSARPAQNFQGRGTGKDRGKMAGSWEAQSSVDH